MIKHKRKNDHGLNPQNTITRILFPYHSGAPKAHRVKKEKERVEPVLKSAALFEMNKFIFGDKEAGEYADAEVYILIRRRPRKVLEKKKSHQHTE